MMKNKTFNISVTVKKHYQEIVDEVCGSMYKHRTLRTLFDPASHEYSQTTMDKKKEILKKLLDSGKITIEEIAAGYKHFYSNELSNKEYVADCFEEGLELLTRTEL